MPLCSGAEEREAGVLGWPEVVRQSTELELEGEAEP